MQQAGIVAVSDDGRPVESAQVMRRALEYCNGLSIPVFVHAEDLSLVNGGAMNEGPAATFWGISGIPNAAEAVMVARDILLSRLTGAHVHFCHISCKESIDLIRNAKQQGICVTCETAPHYFTLTDEDVKDYDTHFKMNPPLRSEKDRQAVIQGLSDGTIDVIASDHAPPQQRGKRPGIRFGRIRHRGTGNSTAAVFETGPGRSSVPGGPGVENGQAAGRDSGDQQ